MEIVAVASSNATIRWSPPEILNGVITQYSILYNGSNIADLGSSALIYTIEELSPDTVYILQMRAHTSVGAGPPSNLTIVTCKLFMLLHVIVICVVIIIACQYKLRTKN